MTRAVRITFIGVPPLLRSIIENSFGPIDVRVSWHEQPARSLDAALIQPRPDVIIIGGRSASDLDLPGALLTRFPTAMIVTVGQAGVPSLMSSLRPFRVRLEDISPQQLVHLVRAHCSMISWADRPFWGSSLTI